MKKALFLSMMVISTSAFAAMTCNISSKAVSIAKNYELNHDGVLVSAPIADGKELILGKNEGLKKAWPKGFFIALVDSKLIDPFTQEPFLISGVFGAKSGMEFSLNDDKYDLKIDCITME